MNSRIFTILSLVISLQFFSFHAKADSFECQTFLNLEVIASDIIEISKINEKVSANVTSVAESFLTERAERNFTLEVYLPQHEMRIYSEAVLSDSASVKIAASLWARDGIIDVVCRLLK